MAYHGSRGRTALPFITCTVHWSNVSLNLHWKFACDCLGSFFFLVFYPLKRIITLRIARLLIGVIWIFAIVFTVPLFKMTTLIEFKPDFHVCTFNFGIIGYVITYLLFCYPVLVLLPIIAIILIYAAIGFKLKHTIAPGNQLPSNQHRREQMNRKILAMLFTVVVVLIVCRFPFIFGMMACFSGLKTVCSWNFLFLGWFLVCFNSGINPWIYFIFNEQFRQGAKLLLQKLLPCCFKSQMKWKCWNRLDVKSKRTPHKHTRVATRGVLGTVQRTNSSIKKKFTLTATCTFSSFFLLHHLWY